MNPWTNSITCNAQRLLTKSQMWGKWWHATLLAGCGSWRPPDNLTLCRVCSPDGRPKSRGPPGIFFLPGEKRKKKICQTALPFPL